MYNDVTFLSRDDKGIDILLSNNLAIYIDKKGYTLFNGIWSAEIILYPSKYQRDWSKFKPTWTKPKFDPKTLQPFDKVLSKCYLDKKWEAGLFSHPLIIREEQGFVVNSNFRTYVIPYNDETKHLVGTSDEAPEYYRYWED